MQFNRTAAPATFAARLEALGYSSYDSYLGGVHWQKVKRLYFNDPNTTKECLCGETEGLDLHHKTYVRLGKERMSDLQALCRRCHKDVHILAGRGLMKLNLDGYTSEERAAKYAADRAALEAAAEARVTAEERAAELEAAREEAKMQLRSVGSSPPPHMATDGASSAESDSGRFKFEQWKRQARRFRGAAIRALPRATLDDLKTIAAVAHAIRIGQISVDNGVRLMCSMQEEQSERRASGLYSDAA